MKPYFKVLYHLIRFSWKGLFQGRKFQIAPVQMLSWNTRFVCGRNSQVSIGRHVSSDGRTVLIVGDNASLAIGNQVYFNEDCMLSCQKSIQIGDGCKFGPNVKLFDNNHQFSAKEGVASTLKCADIVIGKNCWIGANVTILKGTCIGDHSVIGAGCIVKGEIPKNSVVTSVRELHIQPIRDENE